jgi:hypothetical protein
MADAIRVLFVTLLPIARRANRDLPGSSGLRERTDFECHRPSLAFRSSRLHPSLCEIREVRNRLQFSATLDSHHIVRLCIQATPYIMNRITGIRGMFNAVGRAKNQ